METIRQKFIRDTIRWFARTYPAEWEATKKRVKQMKGTRARPTGADKELEFRFEFTIPVRLFNILDRSLDNPRFLEDKKEANWFAKTIKAFTVPEKW